jgi:hypothetical protein
MKSIFKALVLLTVCLIGIGIWRGWFSFSNTTGDKQKDETNVSVDKEKIREDVQKAKAKVGEEVKEAVGTLKERKGK